MAVQEDVQREAEAREQCQSEKITLVVGMHDGCGGEIEYLSEFRFVGEVRLGGRNQTEENTSCHCKQCGVSFNPYFPHYRDQVTAYRNRDTD